MNLSTGGFRLWPFGRKSEPTKRQLNSLPSGQQTLTAMPPVKQQALLYLDATLAVLQREGIPLRDLRPPQRQLVMDIVEEYAGAFPPAAAAPYLDRVRQAEDELYFAWAGGTTPGDAIYYRIHGTDFLIEFDNRSGEPNHIHSVWYDLKNVFGNAL